MIRRIVSFLALGALLTGPLAAEDSQQSDIEVVVTASRVEEPAENVPANVTVITADDLVTSGQTTLVDALENLAGLHFRSSSGNAAQAELSMRGFGENSFGRVLVLLDGRRLNRPDMAGINWLQVPIENIERVEVIRGGSSVQYGDNAVAGVINIITKGGTKGLDVSVSGQYGSFNANQERAGVSGSAGPWRFSANAEHTATDGYRDRSAFRSIAAGTNLGLDLGPLFTTLALSYDNLFFEMPGYLTRAQVEAEPTQAANQADDAKNQYLNADLGLSFGPQERWLLDSHISYGLKFMQTNMASWPKFTDLILHTLAVTPKIKMDFNLLAGDRLVLGVDGYYDLLDQKVFSDVNRNTTTDELHISKVTLGLYGTNEVFLLKVLSLNAGLRYELANIAAETEKTSTIAIDGSKLHQNVVYDVGLLFKPLQHSKIWAKYAKVFRYPFVDEQVMYSGWAPNEFYTDLKPEKGYNIEVGAEIQLFRMLKLGGNGFLLDLEDEITFNFTKNRNVNLDKTRHLGAEAEASLSAYKWAELSGNYTYTQAIFRAGPNEGKTIPLVPMHQAKVEALLNLPLGFSIGSSGQYFSPTYAGGDFDNNMDMLEGYFLWNAFLRYKPTYISGKLELYLGIDNLLNNTTYATTGFDWGTLVVYYPGQGRSWKIGGSYRY